MGVPAFYRWLSNRYPKIVKDCIEEEPAIIGDVEVPVDTSGPNPNGMEFDNLYLDMNGIIHPCFHPEDRPAPTTEGEVFIAIFDYIDRLFGIVRPRKVLYMAIDGVAPRAKMNQQRSRRFRAAQEAEEKEQEEERIRQEFASQGIRIPHKDKSDVFDSNTITPGTPFMHRLSVALQYYIHVRLNTDPGWRNVKVILSDANCPGEGEHKVMAFIREQRGRSGYDPNTRHCVYGLDADLIMLALSTHEPKFAILREVVFLPSGEEKPKGALNAALAATLPGGSGNPEAAAAAAVEEEEAAKKQVAKKPYQFLIIGVLREYLAKEMAPQAFPVDKERLYDDFVFICCFVGNDFLPHMPTLEIREGAIDLLMVTYKQLLPEMGCLCDGANVHLDRLERFITEIGKHEDAIFSKRMRLLQRQKDRRKAEKERGSKWGTRAPAREVAQRAQAVAIELSKTNKLAIALRNNLPDVVPANSNKSAAEKLRDSLKGSNISTLKNHLSGKRPAPKEEKQDIEENSKRPRVDATSFWTDLTNSKREEAYEIDVTLKSEATMQLKAEEEEVKSTGEASVDPEVEKLEASEAEEAAEFVEDIIGDADVDPEVVANNKVKVEEYRQRLKDEMRDKADKFDEMVEHEERIRLGEAGWRERYYAEKFGVKQGTEECALLIKDVSRAFIEGLCWVMKYYYDGVASWTWYYPYHYAPFASDLHGLSTMEILFNTGEPFKPFDQLMGVLPAASAHALPAAYQPLFTSKESPILDFYPKDFEVDMNGKRFAWQGVALLPFIEENRLLSATRSVEHTLTEEEQRRNSRRLELVYVGGSHSLAAEIIDACETAGNPNADDSSRLCAARELDPDVSDGMSGLIAPPSGDPCPTIITAPFKGLGEDITTNSVVCGVYLLPPHQPHVSRLLPGAEEDESVVSDSDVGPEPALWHEDRRGPHRNFNHRSNGQQQDRRGPPSQYMVQQSYHASQQQQYGYQAPMYQNYNQPPQGYGYGVQPGYAQQPSYPGGTYNQPPPGYGYSPQQAHYYPHPQQSQYTGQYPAGNYAGGSGGPFMPNPAMLPGQQQGNSAQLQSSNPYAALWRPKRS